MSVMGQGNTPIAIIVGLDARRNPHKIARSKRISLWFVHPIRIGLRKRGQRF